MPDNTVEIIIRAKTEEAVAAFKKIQDSSKQSLEGVKTRAKEATASFEGLISTAKMLAGVFGISFGLQGIQNLTRVGAAAQQTEDSFRAVALSADESADEILGAMKRATAGTIDASALMQKATKGMVLELSGGDMTKIAEMSRLAARTMGTDVSSAFDMITDAISTKMPRALRAGGLITKDEMKVINDAVAAGVENVNLLTVAYEGFLRAQQKMGPTTENTAEQIQRANAEWKELEEHIAKRAFTEPFAALTHPIQSLGIIFGNLSNQISVSSKELRDFLGISTEVKAAVPEAHIKPSAGLASYMFGATTQIDSGNAEYIAKLREATMRAKVDFDALVREGIVNKADVPALIEKFAGKDKDWDRYLINRKQNIQDLQIILKSVEAVQTGKEALLSIEDAAFAKKTANEESIRSLNEKNYAFMQTRTRTYYEEDAKLSEMKSRAMEATGERQVKLLDEYIAKATQMASKYGEEGAAGLTGKFISSDMASEIERASRIQQDAYDRIAESQKSKLASDQALLDDMVKNIRDVKVEIDGMYGSLDRPMKVMIQTDEAMAKVRQVQEAIGALLGKGISMETQGAMMSTSRAAAPTFNYNEPLGEAWTPPGETVPVIFEPQITMSPAVPWREGIANMEDMLSDLGNSMTGAMDMSGASTLIGSMAQMAKQIQQMGSISEMWSATPGYKNRARSEVIRYEELYNAGLQMLRGAGGGGGGGAGGVTVKIDTINVNGSSSSEMVKNIDTAIAQEIKYGRSQILTVLEEKGLMS